MGTPIGLIGLENRAIWESSEINESLDRCPGFEVGISQLYNRKGSEGWRRCGTERSAPDQPNRREGKGVYRVVWASFIGCGMTDSLLANAHGILRLVAEERLGVCTLISVVPNVNENVWSR